MLSVDQAVAIFGRALAEFAPDWEIAHGWEVNQRNPDEWPSGLGTFGFIIRHAPSGMARILGKRKGHAPNASFHRGISFRVLEAYQGGFIEPMVRYLAEIGVTADGSIATPTNNVLPIGSAARPFFRRKTRPRPASVPPNPRTVPPRAGYRPPISPAAAPVRAFRPEPVSQWIRDAESLVPDVFHEYESLCARAEAARQECERFRRKVRDLQMENRDLRSLRDENHLAFGRLMREMVKLVELTCQVIREKTSQLPPPLDRRLAS